MIDDDVILKLCFVIIAPIIIVTVSILWFITLICRCVLFLPKIIYGVVTEFDKWITKEMHEMLGAMADSLFSIRR